MLAGSRQAGYAEEEIVAAGLAQEARGGAGRVFDRFRGRIVFPLADERGRVRGFGARAMGDDDGPKYLNSSECEVFHKGRQLFALDLARRAGASSGSVVLAEGYTDVLALHQAGLTNAVGIMGTALTDDHAALLARVAPVLVLALDADRAGQGAMLKAAEVARRRKLELRVVALPEGADPADLLVTEGEEALARARRARCPSWSSRSSGSWRTPTSVPRKAATGRSRSSARSLGRSGRACSGGARAEDREPPRALAGPRGLGVTGGNGSVAGRRF